MAQAAYDDSTIAAGARGHDGRTGPGLSPGAADLERSARRRGVGRVRIARSRPNGSSRAGGPETWFSHARITQIFKLHQYYFTQGAVRAHTTGDVFRSGANCGCGDGKFG